MSDFWRVLDFPFKVVAYALIQLYRYTLSAFMGETLESPEAIAHWEEFVIETVLRTVDAGTPVEEDNAATHEEEKSWQKQQPAASRAR